MIKATPIGKRAATRETILDHAYELARKEGLEGLSIGSLARHVGMSKSGLFAHFGSREDLQMAVLQWVEARFVDSILRPALMEPRGLSRLRAMILHWKEWGHVHQRGCVLLSAVGEYDGREGVLRDAILRQQRGWREQIQRAIGQAVELKQLDADTEAEQFAFEIYALMLGLHHDAGLFGYDEASQRTDAAFNRLLGSYQTTVEQAHG